MTNTNVAPAPAGASDVAQADCKERDDRLPEYALNYYDSLRARFETLFFDRPLSGTEQKAYAEAKKVVDKGCAGKPLTWADLMRLDLAQLHLLTADALRLRIAELQARLAGMTPALPEGLIPKVDPAAPANIEALRASAELLATRLWQLRMARNARDRYVGELRRTLYWWLLGLIVLFAVLTVGIGIYRWYAAPSVPKLADVKKGDPAAKAKKDDLTTKDAKADAGKKQASPAPGNPKDAAEKEQKKDAEPMAVPPTPSVEDKQRAWPYVGRVPLFFVIMVAGMIGALISILRRLQGALTAPPSSDLGSELSALAYERRMTLISLYSGAVFAIVLYVTFVAGLSEIVGGGLAPAIAVPAKNPDEGTNFFIFVTEVGPKAPADYARVILWSFIAGFFEQFVPDVLDRIVKKK
jgi:hypothetical protein